MRILRGPGQRAKGFIIPSNERFLFLAPPPLQSSLTFNRVFQPLELLRPYKLDRTPVVCVALKASFLMLAYPLVQACAS